MPRIATLSCALSNFHTFTLTEEFRLGVLSAHTPHTCITPRFSTYCPVGTLSALLKDTRQTGQYFDASSPIPFSCGEPNGTLTRTHTHTRSSRFRSICLSAPPALPSVRWHGSMAPIFFCCLRPQDPQRWRFHLAALPFLYSTASKHSCLSNAVYIGTSQRSIYTSAIQI